MKKALLALLALTLMFFLAACETRSYNVETDLSPEEITAEEENIAKYDDLINNYDAFQEKVLALFTEEEREAIAEGSPPLDWFIYKSRSEKALGRNDDAIKTLKLGLEYYEVSSVLWHNSAKIYHNGGDCKKAEKYYTKIIETIGHKEYYYDIAHCYIRSGENDEKARENYLKFIGLFPDSRDGEFDDIFGL